MSVRDRWIEVFYKVATGSRSVRTLLTPIGATFFLLLTASFVYLSVQLDVWLEFPGLVPKPWNVVVSLPILVVAFLLYLWTGHHFFKARGTPVPFNPPRRLVNTGPYAYCRNPMLSGVFLMLFGLGILLRSISLVFIFTPLYILLNVLELKNIEEPELAKRLGQDYLEYRDKTPMFIPRLGGHNR